MDLSEPFMGPPSHVQIVTLRKFLGNSYRGGRPADLRVVADWASFLSRHVETFRYDEVTQSLSLRAPAVDPVVEARVVGRLKEQLRGGPDKACRHRPNARTVFVGLILNGCASIIP